MQKLQIGSYFLQLYKLATAILRTPTGLYGLAQQLHKEYHLRRVQLLRIPSPRPPHG